MDTNIFSKRIIPLHKRISKRIKEYELEINGYPPRETSNEMRYSLRAVIDILILYSTNDDPEIDELHQAEERAYHALLCGYHDLVDGLFQDIIGILSEILIHYEKDFIQEFGDKRSEIYSFVNEVKSKIVNSREETNCRRKIYDEVIYEDYFQQLLEYRKYLMEMALPHLIERDLRSEEEQKKLVSDRQELKNINDKLDVELSEARKDRKIAYWIAGISISLSILFFVLS